MDTLNVKSGDIPLGPWAITKKFQGGYQMFHGIRTQWDIESTIDHVLIISKTAKAKPSGALGCLGCLLGGPIGMLGGMTIGAKTGALITFEGTTKTGQKFIADCMDDVFDKFTTKIQIITAISVAEVAPKSQSLASASNPTERLRQLTELREQGLITEVEFEQKKDEILKHL